MRGWQEISSPHAFSEEERLRDAEVLGVGLGAKGPMPSAHATLQGTKAGLSLTALGTHARCRLLPFP